MLLDANLLPITVRITLITRVSDDNSGMIFLISQRKSMLDPIRTVLGSSQNSLHINKISTEQATNLSAIGHKMTI